MKTPAKPREIDATQAREKVKAGEATLVCAHEDDARSRAILLDGSLTMSQFRASLDGRSRDEEIIFYCASPEQAASSGAAEQLHAQGFTSARYLIGGVENWKYSGYPLATETAEQHPSSR